MPNTRFRYQCTTACWSLLYSLLLLLLNCLSFSQLFTFILSPSSLSSNTSPPFTFTFPSLSLFSPPLSPSFYSFLPRLRSLPGVVHGTGSGSLSLKQGFMISFLISLASLPCQCHQLLVCALDDLLDPGHPLVQPVDNGHLGDELGKQS